MTTELQTDLEVVDEYIEKCRQFVNPRLLGKVTSRGLYNVINFLPTDIKEAKAVARARMAKSGKYFGDDMDDIAGRIQRLEALKKQLSTMNMADPHETLTIINEMKEQSEWILNYYK